ncbi:hypothetical protein MAFF212519_01740 [Clavibacter michiganensis]
MRALLTGGRAKIGMHIALRLLRDGAHTTITTRFPRDAVRRFAGLPDAHEWVHRLRIVGLDLRDPAQVIGLTDAVAAAGPLDILINNAAQTVRRSPGSYAPLSEAEAAPLPDGDLPELLTFGHTADAHPAALAASVAAHPILSTATGITAAEVTELAMTAGSSSLARLAAGTAIDAGGLVPDLHDANSWTQVVHEVDPLEMLEVQLANVTAPFLLVSRLRPAMAASASRRKYIVNVSAMEGQFARAYKGPGHPHTNMAKAALNMMTRTSAREMRETDGILMTSVDTGWITDERPHPTKVRLAEEGFHAPLDLVDGAPGSTTPSSWARPARTSRASSSRTTASPSGDQPRRLTPREARTRIAVSGPLVVGSATRRRRGRSRAAPRARRARRPRRRPRP